MSRRRRPSASNTRATPYSPAPVTDAGLLSLVGRDAWPLLQAFKEAR